MLHNIDLDSLNALKERDPEAAVIIDTLIANHTEILASISHEVRNPLALVYSSLQIIAQKHPEAKDFQFWEPALDSLEYMKSLLEELSAFSNGARLNRKYMNLSPYLVEIVNGYSVAIERQPTIKLDYDIPSELPLMYIDKVKFREVMLNLLRNAQDSLLGRGSVFVSVKVEDEDLVIAIIDDGYGMSDKQFGDAFKMFKTYKNKGTGLGLPLSRRIVEAHGGTLTATTELYKGSVFTIRIPIQQDS